MRVIGALIVAVLGAGAGYTATYVVKHHVPALWFAWFGSGAAIAFVLGWWKPRHWIVAGLSTPSLVLAKSIACLGDAHPTAAALGLGFGAFWAALSLLGAAWGKALGAATDAPPS